MLNSRSKFIFKEGILYSEPFCRFPIINDPNYLSPKVICDQPDSITTTPISKVSGIPAGSPVHMQSNSSTPAYSLVVVDITPAPKPAVAKKSYTHQLHPGKKQSRVENNEKKSIDSKSE